jgi:hypothetical protein
MFMAIKIIIEGIGICLEISWLESFSSREDKPYFIVKGKVWFFIAVEKPCIKYCKTKGMVVI